MNWGKWIIVAFVLFAGFIATLVTVCMREDVSLVSKEYYREELAYQEQIIRINNVNKLSQRPVIQKTEKFVEVEFAQFSDVEKGSLKLFRPSDEKMDKVFVLNRSSETRQFFPIENLEKGMYRARLQWTMDGKEFFMEEIIYI